MTVIISLLYPTSVFQASDRLITANTNPVDPTSNKSVIYRATNAIVAIGYTGLAHIGKQPTDEWIAYVLWGQDLPKNEDGIPFSTSYQESPRSHFDLGRAVKLLAAEGKSALEKERIPQAQKFLQISIAGWQWRIRGQRIRSRPVLYKITIQQEEGKLVGRWDVFDRYWHYKYKLESGTKIFFCVVDVVPNKSGKTMKLERMISERSLETENTVGDKEDFLKEQISEISKNVRTVGADSMVISISPPNVGIIKAVYEARSITPEVSINDRIQTGSYTPWIVSPNMVSSPQIFKGKISHKFGGYELHYDFPSSDAGGILAYSITQPRLRKR